jgi:hypothetical protein
MLQPVADRSPRLPGDTQDHDGDYKRDQGITQIEAERDDDRTQYDPEADEGIGSRVVSIGHKGRAVQSLARTAADECCDKVAPEADASGKREGEQVLGSLRIDDPRNGFVSGEARADEDREHDRWARVALGTSRAQGEGHTEWDGSEGISDVVDQVGEERDAVGCNEDHGLQRGRRAENEERQDNRPQTGTGTDDRTVDQPMRMAGIVRVPVVLSRLERR